MQYTGLNLLVQVSIQLSNLY